MKTVLCGVILSCCACSAVVSAHDYSDLSDQTIRDAFSRQSVQINSHDLDRLHGAILQAQRDHCRYSPTGGNSKVKFAAVQIAQELGLNPKVDTSVVDRITSALESLPCGEWRGCDESSRYFRCRPLPRPTPWPDLGYSWDEYFRSVIGLNHDGDFLRLVNARGFSPVKISWEDIGRYENSVWGDRISDVGIWVRRSESDSQSAELALSVRRDHNFRDKILMVPIENIKVHSRSGGRTRETNLRERLEDLDLASRDHDKQVIVSNQFAIVPVPGYHMRRGGYHEHAERAAFNFSIFPYGSTNFVITDVIEGSSEAVVGPGNHQLLYADIDGRKAPFTASRAEDRQDLLRLEADLKARGMDVDVQRYYLIQIPLRKDGRGIELSNMGSPPHYQYYFDGPVPILGGGFEFKGAQSGLKKEAGAMAAEDMDDSRGFSRVAIGHGESEGEYRRGSGFRGMRAEEPIRVTVVYFVTPVGKVNSADMEAFAKAFECWDAIAIWGGSFVVKEG